MAPARRAAAHQPEVLVTRHALLELSERAPERRRAALDRPRHRVQASVARDRSRRRAALQKHPERAAHVVARVAVLHREGVGERARPRDDHIGVTAREPARVAVGHLDHRGLEVRAVRGADFMVNGQYARSSPVHSEVAFGGG